jgi:hypothetical protein
VAASNVVVEGCEPLPREELLRRVGNGLYIGRIWYTYPINGPRAGDFTCTVVADSYIIRNGRIAAPLAANVIRINDNIATFLNQVVGVTRDAKATIVWARTRSCPPGWPSPAFASCGIHGGARLMGEHVSRRSRAMPCPILRMLAHAGSGIGFPLGDRYPHDVVLQAAAL